MQNLGSIASANDRRGGLRERREWERDIKREEKESWGMENRTGQRSSRNVLSGYNISSMDLLI